MPLSAAAAACPAAGAAVRRGAISQRSYTGRSAQVADSEVGARARLGASRAALAEIAGYVFF